MQGDISSMPRKLGSKDAEEYYKSTCPKCGAKKVKRLVYGLIDDPFALGPKEVPGGCCISENSPKWYCEACEHEWGNIDINKLDS